MICNHKAKIKILLFQFTFRFVFLFITAMTAISIIPLPMTIPITVKAQEPPSILAKSAVLYDTNSGKVLYGKDEHVRMYPASMTKVMAAMLLVEYFELTELITCGKEIFEIPAGSSKANHKEGETLTVENLLRALIIPSGNETSNVVALAVAKRALNDENISYSEAERWFCNEMNIRAKELGALDTNFVNPHGFHSASHYTTAYDMALIAAEAMKNDDIRRVASERSFVGNGAGNYPSPNLITQDYNWQTHNDLLIPSSPYYYHYATGLKTGFTNEAGDCVAATATKDDRELIAIVMNSKMPGRWQDSIELFNYGFDNFAIEEIQSGDTILGEVEISNPRLGAPTTVEYMALGSFSDLLSKDQLSRIVTELTFNQELIAPPIEDEETGRIDNTLRLNTPIEEGQVIGSIAYTLDGNLLFHSDVISLDEALERTFNSDADYYLEIWKKRATSPLAVPVYTGIVVLIGVIIKINISIKRRRNNNMYRLRKRY